MRNSCGIKCAWLKGCLLLEVGTGLLPLLTGRLFLTLSCNLIFFPIWWWGGVWIYVTVLVQLLFGWWPIVPSLERTKVSLCKQEGEAGEGPLTQTLQPSTVHTLFSSCSLFRHSKRLYHLYKPCLREAQKGELIHKKGEAVPNAWPSVCAECGGEGNHTQQCRTMWWQAAAYLKEGKVPIKASGKLSCVWDFWVWPCKYSYCWFCVLIHGPSLKRRTFLKQIKSLLFPCSVWSLQLQWISLSSPGPSSLLWHDTTPLSAAHCSYWLLLFHGLNYCALWSPVGLTAQKEGEKVDSLFCICLSHAERSGYGRR